MTEDLIFKIKERFYYCKNSPSGLKWKIDRFSGQGRKLQVQAGEVAGTLRQNGYWSVWLDNKVYQCHRLVLILHDVSLHNMEVDHIDRNRGNNSFENLRVVDRIQNMRNKTKSKTNTSGHVGVYFSENKGIGYWVATWVDEKSLKKKKHFSVKKHGYELAKHLALEYRKEKLTELEKFGIFYSESHKEQIC